MYPSQKIFVIFETNQEMSTDASHWVEVVAALIITSSY
jgi:hypothetical protein